METPEHYVNLLTIVVQNRKLRKKIGFQKMSEKIDGLVSYECHRG